MFRRRLPLNAVLLLLLGVNNAMANEEIQALLPSLQPLSNNAVLVEAVKQHNLLGLPLAEILRRDKQWQSAEASALVDSISDNAASEELKIFMAGHKALTELFLMGNQGANIAMTNKTSDYWQGDEAKWQKAYKLGEGASYVGEMEFDESAQAYLIQVSLPILDGTLAIGAITVGVNLEEL